MPSADLINAAVGVAGLIAVATNVLALWRSRDGRACNPCAIAYFVLGALWSVYYCGTLGQWWTVAVCCANVVLHLGWLGVLVRNRGLEAEPDALLARLSAVA